MKSFWGISQWKQCKRYVRLKWFWQEHSRIEHGSQWMYKSPFWHSIIDWTTSQGFQPCPRSDELRFYFMLALVRTSTWNSLASFITSSDTFFRTLNLYLFVSLFYIPLVWDLISTLLIQNILKASNTVGIKKKTKTFVCAEIVLQLLYKQHML